MEITYLGHSSFRLKTKKAIIVTDPFDPAMVGLKFPKIPAELVTISHDHHDHNKHELVTGVRMVIDGPGEYEASDISIVGIETYHDNEEGKSRGKNIIYIYEAEGLRLAHLGDLGHKLSDKTIEDLGTLDVLMIPVGGFYTIDAGTASEMVRAIDPSVVIPMHYKIPGMKDETFGELSGVEDFLKEVGLPVEETEKYVIKKGDIFEGEKKVVLLKPKT
jgi:L-ascorbate metabolism protein UlaG (beta-lactamase superfamily)